MSTVSPERLAHAEERIAWLERHVGEQDKAMLEFARDLERLRAEVILIKTRTVTGGAGLGSGGGEGDERALADERPPHY